MNETVKINLAQRLFDLDQEAYDKLKDYLDSLKNYFSKSPEEAEDIIFDIEQRIAELLTERMQGKKQVVTLADVETVIEMMGTPEDFAREADEGEAENESTGGRAGKSYSADDYSKEHRRFYRDVDNNIIGGVCSGLAAYFNTEAIWIRLAFIVLFFMNLIGLIIYVIIWVIVPAAVTTAQKLQMRGKPVNIGNIQDSVKSEFGKMKDNFHKFTSSENFKRGRDTAEEAAKAVGNAFLILVKVILVIIGVGLAVAGLALLISLLAAIAAGGVWHGWHLPDFTFSGRFLDMFREVTFFSIAIFIVILIPVIAILSGIIRLVFNLKRRSGVLPAFGWTIWSLALVFVLITVILGFNNVAIGQHYREVKTLNVPDKKVLYLRLDENDLNLNSMNYYTIFGKELIRDKWGEDFLLEPEMRIEPSEDETTRLQIEYSTVFPWEDEMDYDLFNFTFRDTILVIDNYWRIDEDEFWRLPRVCLTLYVPEGQEIHIDPDFKKIPAYTGEDDPWPAWYYRQKLIMEDNSLVPEE